MFDQFDGVAREHRSKADIDAAFADGFALLVGGQGDDGFGLAFFVVGIAFDGHGIDDRRAHGSGDEKFGDGRIFDTVDIFAQQFIADGIDTHAFDPDGGTDGIDLRMGGKQGDFGTFARNARGFFDDDQAVVDFGHFEAKQFFEEFRRSA